MFIYWVSTLCQIPHALYSIILFNLYHNTEMNKGTERSCTLLKITQLVNGKASLWTQAIWLSPTLLTTSTYYQSIFIDPELLSIKSLGPLYREAIKSVNFPDECFIFLRCFLEKRFCCRSYDCLPSTHSTPSLLRSGHMLWMGLTLLPIYFHR